MGAPYRPHAHGQRSGEVGGSGIRGRDRDLGRPAPGDTLSRVMTARAPGPQDAAPAGRGSAGARTLRGPHVRLPDERARLRAAVRPARGGRLRPARRPGDDAGRRRPQHLRGPGERRQPALRQPRPPAAGQGRPARACRSRSAAAWRRRTAARSCAGRPGSTSSSARTTSARCRCCWSGPGIEREAQVEIAESLETFPSTLPTRRESAYSAWVSISVGCDNTCTFCIVPSLRGREKDRRPGDVLAEIEALVAQGVLEVTLLGQNVNSYGARVRRPVRVRRAAARRRRGRRAGAGPVHLAAPARLHRRRDRRDGRDAERSATRCTCRCSPARTRCCGRCAAPTGATATSASWTGCGPRCRTRRSPPTSSSASRARPRPTSSRRSTWSGEARVRRRVHLPVLAAARHAGGRRWTARCRGRSCRSGTSGWSRCRTRSRWAANRALVGSTVEVLVAEGEGRKDAATGRRSGRARDGRLVHFACDVTDGPARATW